MDFFKALKQLDNEKENKIITYLTGENTGSKAIFADNKIVFTNNYNIDWNSLLSLLPSNKKSQIIVNGEQKIFVEFIRQNYNVVICGAGHISMPVIKMCKLLDLPSTVIDDRLMFINNAKEAGADTVMYEPFEDALDKIQGDSGTFFIIVTRGHRYDQICLEKIIKKENAYIGMIGSKLRVSKVLDYLEEKGISRDDLNKVYTPIGLRIGAETPAEIAVSIMAEVIQVKNKRSGKTVYDDEILNTILNELYYNIPKATATIVSRKGSSPREVGTKMVIFKDGTAIGTIGGGCVEADVRQKALRVIDNQESQLIKVDMTGVDAEEDGMVCGGIIEVFIEPITNSSS
ncbi:XdhC/CoxI family protein [Sedimentibacter sp.]|uniref:XdhC/CoxI family protein n=1 Tax=Sedimentibacter sp. TaxID=1960295 RepID=UPI0028AAA027|nr:XdhC/CoxI family protein [Sedimentibacter sp.]